MTGLDIAIENQYHSIVTATALHYRVPELKKLLEGQKPYTSQY